ncbi:hypothetical protein H0H81_001565, partial [Sphagnurus paluster]
VHDDETAHDNCIDPAVSPSSSTIECGFSLEDNMGDALEVAGENSREEGHRKAEGRGKGHEREKPAKRVHRDFIPSLATTKSKGRVEYFIDQVLSNPFVSLEAKVDHDAKEDNDKEVTDKFETFLDDSEPVPGVQASSRSILLQEHERLYNETDWEELLDRTRTRSRIQFSLDGPAGAIPVNVARDFLPEEVFPTVDKLSAFELVSYISAERMHHFRELAEAQWLKPGDYVVVADGQSKGCLGTVHSISGNEAVVDLEGETAQETVALRQLRKNVVVGEIYDQDSAKEPSGGAVHKTKIQLRYNGWKYRLRKLPPKQTKSKKGMQSPFRLPELDQFVK